MFGEENIKGNSQVSILVIPFTDTGKTRKVPGKKMSLILDKFKVTLRYPRDNIGGVGGGKAVDSGQGSANYGPWAKSSPHHPFFNHQFALFIRITKWLYSILFSTFFFKNFYCWFTMLC